MNQMNQILVEGNVVRDSQVRETARGTRVCIIPIATNRYYRDTKGAFQKETAYFDVEAWGENFCKLALRMAKKGRGLRVVGRLKQDRWKGQDGKSLSKIFIVAEHIEFQPEKNSESKSGDNGISDAESAAEGFRVEADIPVTDDFSDGGDGAVF